MHPPTLEVNWGTSSLVWIRFRPVSADSQSGLILVYNHPVPPETLFVSASMMADSGQGKPARFALEWNYPNPFSAKTVVSSQLPVAIEVKLVVYDLLGREVAVLANRMRAAGYYYDTFDASGLASGVYLCRMSAGAFVQTRRMILVR